MKRDAEWPAEPACWSWAAPPLPQPNDMTRIKAWQAGRCAVCGCDERPIWEDHDHGTGYSRGFLCPRCNANEGSGRKGLLRNAPPVFDCYRKRPPAAIFGIRPRYKARVQPEAVEAQWRITRAFAAGDFDSNEHDPEILELARSLAAVGYTRLERLQRAGRARRLWLPSA